MNVNETEEESQSTQLIFNTNTEKKEIGFAKKYQILSKNTALFAQIINEQNQQSE